MSVLAAPLTLALVRSWQGINSSFELSLQGPNANAFTVSPTTIVGTGEVQILVQNSALVDYEISHVMVVQVGLVGLACSVEAVPAPCMHWGTVGTRPFSCRVQDLKQNRALPWQFVWCRGSGLECEGLSNVWGLM